MKSIFESNYFNIVAASAVSTVDGFLSERRPKLGTEVGKVPVWTSTNDLVEIVLHMMDLDVCDRSDPVHLRAWTLGDWLLPQRHLIFTSGQLAWKCSGFAESDGGFEAPGLPYELRRIRGLQFPRPPISLMWADLLPAYTARRLTDPADKLVAIEGLAQRISQQRKLNYFCGLWEEDIAREICWPSAFEPPSLSDPSALSRSRLINCPTWSWGSVKYPVRIHDSATAGAAQGSEIPSN